MAIDQGAGGGTSSAGALPAGALSAGAMSVGQLAARAGVRVDTVRYYERAGLLPRPRRTGGDHRRYGPADVDRLLFIRGARRLGLRLAEIRALTQVRDTGTCPCAPAEALLREHVGEIDREISRLTALRAELTEVITGLSDPAVTCQDPVPVAWCAPDCQGTQDAEGGDRDVLLLR